MLSQELQHSVWLSAYLVTCNVVIIIISITTLMHIGVNFY